MRIKSLETLVVADVHAQHAAYLRGELDGLFDGETWAEYVANLAYWEDRDGLTSEHVADRVLPSVPDNGGRRLVPALTAVWFAEARRLVWSPPRGTDMVCPVNLVRVEIRMSTHFLVDVVTGSILDVATWTPNVATLRELIGSELWTSSTDQRFDVDADDELEAVAILDGAQWPDSRWLA